MAPGNLWVFGVKLENGAKVSGAEEAGRDFTEQISGSRS